MVSVIIPVLNEEVYIGKLLSAFNKRSDDFELIVVDGGSTDNTEAVVKNYNQVNYINSVRGRASQMNAGAKMGNGEKLFFIHADSQLSDELLGQLPYINSQAATFTLKFDSKRVLYRFYAWFTKYNYSLFTYGDQGLFVSKELFFKVGGYKIIPLLEDVDLLSRIRKINKVDKLPYTITTSARRFEKNGILLQQLRNIVIMVGYYLGINPHFLARYYKY
ncbi:TIGR04283 family arsenosugar biosynthesis glycosyltransferase [Fulvivirga lutea]|uniref:TIGR04283 family arsenosugar biosynthesis glycosyltransferase n=1 Tax=Fulvivirga lutea TaxID=2810512 RepID=A0A974WJA4_9BACT|nr:TIGR04283 family arsenosugar biosynthesis glycosyltransferase [Fulvivirga lutea]QSE97190.1 TIGR04283 family arsenosugar biosynthesis glycosyltransferase [Fulvivirga lutea]